MSWCAVNAAGGPAAFAAVGNGVPRLALEACAPGGLGRRPPNDLAFYPKQPVAIVRIVAEAEGADGGLLVLHCSSPWGGRGVLLRRQGRGLHRPGPPLPFVWKKRPDSTKGLTNRRNSRG